MDGQQQNVVTDKYGNKYSPDGRTLIKGANISSNYVSAGCEVIGPGAFEEADRLASISLPDSLTEISKFAFYGCRSLEHIHLPDKLSTIGYCAFFDSRLSSICLPESLVSVGEEAFGYCCFLDRFSGKFASDDGRFLVQHEILMSFAPHGKIKIQVPDYVVTIVTRAFSCCHELETVIIPDSVVAIGSRAFNLCRNLQTIIIPESLKWIARDAFYECSPYLRIVKR